MTSIGNDIIGLKIINPQLTKQERFYSKILSFSELELYYRKASETIPLENFIWLLWSIKESVYKYQKRNFPDLLFSPGKIIIQDIDVPEKCTATEFGTVQYESNSFPEVELYCCQAHLGTEVFYSRSKIHNDLIYTVVNNTKSFENIWWGIKFIDDVDYVNQSTEVRNFVLDKLSSIFPNDDLQIEKREAGYPVLLKAKKELDLPISFTHHTHFIAYSFLWKTSS